VASKAGNREGTDAANTDRYETVNGMTDHPRFEPVRSVPDQAHLGYHGGRLVGSVLRLADWWRAMRAARRAGGFDVFNTRRAGRPSRRVLQRCR
jgi:hypothetical protein